MGGSEGTLVIKIICTPKNQRLLALRIDYVLVTPSFPSKENFTNKIAIPSSSWHEKSFQMLLVRFFWLFQCNLMRYSKTLLETFHQCNGELVTFDTWKSGSTRFSSLSKADSIVIQRYFITNLIPSSIFEFHCGMLFVVFFWKWICYTRGSLEAASGGDKKGAFLWPTF